MAWNATWATIALIALPCLADEPAYGASAKVERPIAARNDQDATAAATSVDLAGRPMPLESVRDVMREVPGSLATDTGAYGSFSSLSVRGAELGQTVWLLGDVPLNSPETGAFDISLLPLGHLQRIEVYRSGAPVWLGQGSIGGVVRVLPQSAKGTGASAQLGAASFGRYELRGLASVRRDHGRPVSLLTSVQATRATNDFRYTDDQGTRDRSDDSERRLRNAGVVDGSGLSHLRVGALGGAVDVVAYGLSRVGGAPGAPGRDTNAIHARTRHRRALAVASYTRDGKGPMGRAYRLQFLVSAQNEVRGVYDPYDELPGVAVSSGEQRTRRLSGRGAASVALLRSLEATLVASYANDHFESEYATDVAAGRPGIRNSAAIAPELRLHGRLLGLRGELRGSVRGERSHTARAYERVSRLELDEQSATTYVSRLSFALEPTLGLSLRGQLGTGRRLPSFLELYGDGVGRAQSPLLKPERGRYADLGAVLSQAFGPTCIVVEASGYVSRVEDKIVWNTNFNARTAWAANVASADIAGIELGAEASYRRFLRLVSSLNAMHTRTDLGKQLPGQPKLHAYTRAEGSLQFARIVQRLTGFATVEYLSTAFFDRANTVLRPQRTLLGLGAALAFLEGRLELAVRVSDLLDVRGTDSLGFPLPGRSFALVASLKEDEP
jgi:vitamin B12 transporter